MRLYHRKIIFFALLFIPIYSTGSQTVGSKNRKTLTLGFAGDTMLGRLMDTEIAFSGCKHLWGDVLPLLRQNDFNLINLETTLTTSTQMVPKVFNFKAQPAHVCTLKEANITAVNLANNHVLDFNVQGLIETLQTLDAAGIYRTGAGLNLEEAQTPAIIIKNGIRIGIIGYTDNEPTWKAETDKPGINYIKVGDISPLKKIIQKRRPQVDLLIVTSHWGPNMRTRPSLQFRKFAHQLIEAGADIIHGHSAHIFQGIEIYKNKVILYDSGDLIDDYAIDPLLRNDQSFLYRITIEQCNNSITIKQIQLIPLIIANMQVNVAKGKERQQILKRMQKLSAEFGTFIDDNGCITMPAHFNNCSQNQPIPN